MQRMPKKPSKPPEWLKQTVAEVRRRNTREKRKDANRRAKDRERFRELQDSHQIANMRSYLKVDQWHRCLFDAVVANQLAVAASYGLSPSVNAMLTTSPTPTCSTDFKDIKLFWPLGMLPASPTMFDEAVQAAAMIRGAFAHELGHIRYSIPLHELINLTTVPLPPDCASRRGDPLLDDEGMPLCQSNGEVRTSARSAVRVTVNGVAFQQAWNMLEDQRMEAAVVREVPRISNYLTLLIMRLFTDARNAPESAGQWYTLTCGRSYLPEHFVQVTESVYSPGENQVAMGGAAYFKGIVERYKQATDLNDMLSCVLMAYEYLQADPVATSWLGVDDHKPPLSYSSAQPMSEEEASEIAQDSASPNGGAGDADTAEDSTTPGDEDSTTPSDSHAGVGTDQSPHEMAKEIEQQLLGDASHDVDLRELVKEAVVNNDSMVCLPYSGECSPMTDVQVATSKQLSVGVQRTLSDFVVANSPHWQKLQDEGYIDPLAYRTKAVGQRNFRRNMSGSAVLDLDMHVSVLADISGSMGSAVTDLSMACYGISDACVALNVPHTMLLWSNDAQHIYQNGPEPLVYRATGGTTPENALFTIDRHNATNAKDHLTLILTDGLWDESTPRLTNWAAPGRHIVLVTYRMSHMLAAVSNYGADAVFNIDELMELPAKLTDSMRYLLGSR